MSNIHIRNTTALKTGIGLLILAASATLMTSCAGTPPTAQMALSSEAVDSATNAGGGVAAPVEMQSARQKLDQAKRAMAEHEYDKAKVLARDAQVDAQLAEAKADSAKARAAAAELQKSILVLSNELDRQQQ